MSAEIVPINGGSGEIRPMDVLTVAIQQNADVDKLAKLLELQERWEANQARKAFNAAMAKFKQNPPPISKNKHVKFGNTNYTHATLDHVVDQITKALSAVGIAHKWDVEQVNGLIAVGCVLTHELGHSERTVLAAGADTSGSKNSIQAIGSTVTYLQRYTLLAATGLAAADQDDDGHGAEQKRMPEAAVIEWVEAIRSASDADELKVRVLEAMEKAKQAGDAAAIQQFQKAKVERWNTLKGGR